ncbi:HAD family phosphatase [Sphaerisporangium sp. TRM90804]|uniref:HAD family hydrolase n=1 Tax=Sphaerisporangium sp. TRM90804 TaxID=3031113 RepID=UPI00244D38B1|nr:HAD family phosphatase [Sphaerisporangium sp. TRM90804]MDH2427873.1 HAD family phosphatase [Sphaerisporangium sp. TRM90804]
MLRGVLIDWGGVLTTSLHEAIAEWIAADGIDGVHYRDMMGVLVREAYEHGAQGENPIHALERGEVDVPAFERDLAARLVTVDGGPPVAEGMLRRMFEGFRPVPQMYEMLAAARGAGLVTCLVSNSWGDHYVREGWEGYFDQVVISGEVGMRKPEPRIFHHALGLVGLPAEHCAFVDDAEANIVAARAVGLVGVHHLDTEATIRRIETMAGLSLRTGNGATPAAAAGTPSP